MISYIEKDSNDLIYCPDSHDGRIRKVFFIESKETIYVCEDCEATWLTLEKIFEIDSCIGFTEYLKKNDLKKAGKKTDWDKILVVGDFVTFSEVKSVVEKNKIEVVEV